MVLGGGFGGYLVVFCVVDLGIEIVIVDLCDMFGGVCFNVGCIFLKVFFYVVKVMKEVKYFVSYGVLFGEFIIDLDKICEYKDGVVK